VEKLLKERLTVISILAIQFRAYKLAYILANKCKT